MKCCTCKTDKELGEFNKGQKRCRECAFIYYHAHKKPLTAQRKTELNVHRRAQRAHNKLTPEQKAAKVERDRVYRETHKDELAAKDRLKYVVNRTKKREQAKAWLAKNREKMQALKKIRFDRNRELIDRLKSGPCMDCGGAFPPYVMDFDHRDPATKYRPVSQLTGRNEATILAEIDKCDLVCANCHRIRTYSGLGRDDLIQRCLARRQNSPK